MHLTYKIICICITEQMTKYWPVLQGLVLQQKGDDRKKTKRQTLPHFLLFFFVCLLVCFFYHFWWNPYVSQNGYNDHYPVWNVYEEGCNFPVLIIFCDSCRVAILWSFKRFHLSWWLTYYSIPFCKWRFLWLRRWKWWTRLSLLCRAEDWHSHSLFISLAFKQDEFGSKKQIIIIFY